MPPTIFADAWYFIAIRDRFDMHHAQARRLQARYVSSARLMTHDAVLTEVLAYFSTAGARPRGLAIELVRNALATIEVIAHDRSLFLRAVDLYAARPDKEYSLVDCMSMLLMRDRGVTRVFTNDHHFRQEGFTVLSDAQ